MSPQLERCFRDGDGLANVALVVADAVDLAPERADDVVITAVDAIHEQQRPEDVLRATRDALAPGGVFVMVDTNFAAGVGRQPRPPVRADGDRAPRPQNVIYVGRT
ncbi:hypothetical protein I4I73_11760 [Pseudonocardia sp. KRD-184]|uniref:Methyltransferase family protein n=1 Tax=Pseudonocardia oceani TaxID=2792013 RepID=A0ABS6UIC6_9PSEU|nr:class I SAM-dependent methyltransferase [Pseudonocardia oceani]MBW0090876.1 hypothetical protein [Pseudonocardia oceani]MBW0096662.1 hypothetical protein [Pseudonocardia oceani]MBW0110544.1 hypothetical protein [Pseudonocardia oceani]MBW0122118.1 hypothetical protein [Pseudonocardia oceani]MBW0131980.1 hypothetical protein [Pseudonocardia oceani]